MLGGIGVHCRMGLGLLEEKDNFSSMLSGPPDLNPTSLYPQNNLSTTPQSPDPSTSETVATALLRYAVPISTAHQGLRRTSPH